MSKLIWLALVAALACKLLFGRWPWELAATSPRSQDDARARALLGVRRDATREEIIDAHRRRIAQVHPDRGGTVEQVHEVNAARDLLLGRLIR
ncbi:MAG: J domain-containing protein [Novosphingobium sp.]|nr:J domain-containing protein [Novosphingobium sp.]